METGFLLGYFRMSPEKIETWKSADCAMRRKLFDPVQIRKALDMRDGAAGCGANYPNWRRTQHGVVSD